METYELPDEEFRSEKTSVSYKIGQTTNQIGISVEEKIGSTQTETTKEPSRNSGTKNY